MLAAEQAWGVNRVETYADFSGRVAELRAELLRIIRQLIEDHQKFLFVASEPSDRALLTIGEALRPLEYAIVRSFRVCFLPIFDR